MKNVLLLIIFILLIFIGLRIFIFYHSDTDDKIKMKIQKGYMNVVNDWIGNFYFNKYSSLPNSLLDLKKIIDKEEWYYFENDIWGNNFIYINLQNDSKKIQWKLISIGPDKKKDTTDDIILLSQRVDSIKLTM